jgi:hypothetical protein
MKFIKTVFVFSLLTLFTQIGGLIYLLSKIIYALFRLTPLHGYKDFLRRWSFHIAIYLIFTFFIVPLIAGKFGRVPLPVFEKDNLGPRTIWTAILNRHYVRPSLKATALKISAEMGEKYPGLRINYFDAGHPFYNGYPLIPHLSHDDGKKLDIGFVYDDVSTGKLSQVTPSVIGYGISEEPQEGEINRPQYCGENPKNWTYNFMRNVYPQGAKNKYSFNASISKELIGRFSKEKNIQRILLEPHLKSRLRLSSGKITQVQCGSVRHDDHFHVQIH